MCAGAQSGTGAVLNSAPLRDMPWRTAQRGVWHRTQTFSCGAAAPAWTRGAHREATSRVFCPGSRSLLSPLSSLLSPLSSLLSPLSSLLSPLSSLLSPLSSLLSPLSSLLSPLSPPLSPLFPLLSLPPFALPYPAIAFRILSVDLIFPKGTRNVVCVINGYIPLVSTITTSVQVSPHDPPITVICSRNGTASRKGDPDSHISFSSHAEDSIDLALAQTDTSYILTLTSSAAKCLPDSIYEPDSTLFSRTALSAPYLSLSLPLSLSLCSLSLSLLSHSSISSISLCLSVSLSYLSLLSLLFALYSSHLLLSLSLIRLFLPIHLFLLSHPRCIQSLPGSQAPVSVDELPFTAEERTFCGLNDIDAFKFTLPAPSRVTVSWDGSGIAAFLLSGSTASGIEEGAATVLARGTYVLELK